MVTPTWRPVWAHGSGTLWPAFLAGYLRALSGIPVVTHVTGDTGADLDSQKGEAELLALAAAGGGGCLGPPLIDPAPDVLRTDIYRRGAGQVPRALFASDATPRESVGLWQTWENEPPAVAPLPADFPSPDPERRLHAPEDVAFESFEAFVR
jgi:hypothetical protein